MAAEATLEYYFKLSGLRSQDDVVAGLGTEADTPTASSGVQYRTLAVADTEETLDVGDITTVDVIILKAIDYDVAIDTSFSAAFSTEIIARAGGMPVVFTPGGTVKVKNVTASQTPKYEYLAVGRT